MGYPMTYRRVLERNALGGNYTNTRTYTGTDEVGTIVPGDDKLKMISGDLRRLEHDAIDRGYYRKELADKANVTEDVIVAVLTAFFDGKIPNLQPHDEDNERKPFEGVYNG